MTDDWTDEFEIGTCDDCDRADVRVAFLPDPYDEEVNPERSNEPTWWCHTCWSNRKDDV